MRREGWPGAPDAATAPRTAVDSLSAAGGEADDDGLPLTSRARPAARRSIHCTATGKAYLSARPAGERAALVRQWLAAFTRRTTMHTPLQEAS